MDNNYLKRKLVELNSGGGKRRPIWKPSPGKNIVRIVPYKYNEKWPFTELWFHYDIATKPILSPVTFDHPDPIKDFADMLQSKGGDDWDRGKKLQPKTRIYLPVLVRGEEEEGVKFWGFGVKIYRQLCTTIDDPDWGDITDLKKGRDITIYFEKAQKGGFPNTEFDIKPITSEASKDRGVLALLNDMPDVTKLWDEPTTDELLKLLEAYIEAGEEKVSFVRNNDVDISSGVTESVTNGTKSVSGTNDGSFPTEDRTDYSVTDIEEPNDEPDAASDDDKAKTLAAYKKYFGKKKDNE